MMRVWIPVLMLLLPLNFAVAQQDSAAAAEEVRGVREKIAQKIGMIDRILSSPELLQRVEASKDPVAEALFSRASENFVVGQEYFSQGQYLEAEASLDYVLRDLSASSQLLSLPQQKRSEYRKFVEQLDSFAMPEWIELSDDEAQVLQNEMTRVSELRSDAARLADAESWDQAVALLEQAYRIKVSLLERFRHETLVVYDLDFDTVQDEYQYLVNRTYHYLELVQLVLAQNQIDAPTRKLTDKYLYDSMLGLEAAENLESQGQFSQAIPVLDTAIDRLLRVLKLLGVTI